MKLRSGCIWLRACSISCQLPFYPIWINFNNLHAHGDYGDGEEIEDEDDGDDDDDFDQSDQQIYKTPTNLISEASD